QPSWRSRSNGRVPGSCQRARSPRTHTGGRMAMSCPSDRTGGDRLHRNISPEPVWTPKLVEARLAEAAAVLKRLPGGRVRGYFNTWPQHSYEFADLVGQEPRETSLPPPSPAAISRMEETLAWTIGLDPIDGKIIWMRAHSVPWKAICWRVGLR